MLKEVLDCLQVAMVCFVELWRGGEAAEAGRQGGREAERGGRDFALGEAEAMTRP